MHSGTPDAGSMIRVRDVTFDYDDMHMRFDLTVAAGSLLALIGPSGAGKSTLLNLLAGFERPIAGQIVLAGQDAAGVPPAERPVTSLFQEHNLFAHLTVVQNVGLGRHPGLRLTRSDRAEMADALAALGLDGLDNRLPGQLSGGERQRVALARALIRRKPILLLDEPFAALGPAQRSEMVSLVDGLRRDRGLTVVLVSHQIDELRGLRDAEAAFIDAGQIAARGILPGFLDGDALPALRRYLGAP